MNTYDWTSFNVRINIQTSVASIYKMWATAAGMENWFLRQCEIKNEEGLVKGGMDFIKTGDQFLWRWYGWPIM